jgi:photosystem II stability/assembly factor-like uncharacterized protein
LLFCAIVVALFPASASAGVSVGHSGWEWLSPLPQGNTIRSMDFAGSTGYAVGDFGTLLRTDSSGETWTGLPTGITEDLTRVQALDADTVVAAGGCLAIRSDDGGSIFRRLRWRPPNGSCDSPIVGISFPSRDVGYILLADGEVYRTDDGGETWRALSVVTLVEREGGFGPAGDVLFTDRDTGVVATADGIYRTTDGGFSWALVHEAPLANFSDLVSADAQIYAVCACDAVLKSSDGGISWQPQSYGGGQKVTATSIACADDRTCIVNDDGHGRLLRTVDGGATWAPINGIAALALAFASPDRAVAAGTGGSTLTSQNAGETWAPLMTNATGGFTKLVPHSRGYALVLGRSGTLLQVFDGGRDWEVLNPPSPETLVDASFAGDQVGVVLDSAGSVFRTEDGGMTWTQLDVGVTPPEAVLAPDGDRVLLVGPKGVRLSTDGGQRFKPAVRRAVRKAALFGVDRAGGSLYVWGPLGLFASRDGGETWRALRRPDHRPIADVDFTGSHDGFVLGKGGRLWRTRNRARGWKELLAAGTDGLTEVAFADPRHGYLAASDRFFAKGSGRPDYVLRTSDGGRRWRPQIVSASRDINSLVAIDSRRALLLAGDHLLFRTGSGGDRGDHSGLSLRPSMKVLAGPGSVRLSGAIRRAAPGEHLTVAMRSLDPRARLGGSLDWSFKSARVSSTGRFASTWRIRRTSVFVAQWTGNSERAGSGSTVVKVIVRRR